MGTLRAGVRNPSLQNYRSGLPLSPGMRARFRVLSILLCLAALTPTLGFCQAPRIFYTDLVSGPTNGGQNNNGAFITLYGKRFGATQGSGVVTVGGGAVAGYPVWTDTKVTVQLGASAATGNIVLTNANGASNGILFTVAPGNIYFVATNGGDSASGSYSNPWLT
ncbi:MAG TPA: IPT/TIG domain-containing protein, partial [Bryobacteraceae bacterium]|nr:IPT/TIG domain-containing protein [Bryobacteraceae bacterium]